MKTTDPVRDYLAAVEREASALPADRRQELLADLAEHIEVTRAERPDTALGDILRDLGDPRTIAATALAEAGGQGFASSAPGPAADRRGKVRPLVPLLMLTLPFLAAVPFPDSTALQFLSGVFRIVGAILLCTSAHWTPLKKAIGVVLTFVLPTTAVIIWEETTVAPAGDLPALVANLITLAVLAGTATWLWRTRRP
ncbi:HAAS signaling domain-containing protein [Streptomyces sp. NPDC050145]|uniref:HAAS signaling domain-containing protein n=1 Tax=Streptomyces sp. NPDC050145 TaxID=3365602 RepID=UPI003790B913